MWWLAETVSNCLSTPACQSCPSLIPTPSSLVLLLQLLIIFSLNCRGQTTFSDGVVTLVLLLGKIFYLGKNTQPADMCSCFFGGKKNERGTLVLFFFGSLIPLQNRDYELFLSQCLEVESNPTRWHCENVDEIHRKRMDMCTYSLMYTLEMETSLYRRVWKESFCPWKWFKVINRQSIEWKTRKSPRMYCSGTS